MTPSFGHWIVQQVGSTWKRGSLATKWKINLVLLSALLVEWLLPPAITVLAAGGILAYAYRLYRQSMKQAAREDDSQIHAYAGDSLSDDSLRWAVTTWSRGYRQ
ncbi:hypothetical protein [Mycolicibacterium peregrinum]|uniref:Uncharacterized protein n=1 Tax=Mycolicibacterium peregrinum TaxID=43304 RepID=A0A1A0WBT9_MYCPR|nr:hypothetical protein [Mycolicibacterium peregrinum]OBB94620.1 hypothetical protein A5779_19485 [Mycolicibacterium peregrinum]